MLSCVFYQISKNTFFLKICLVATTEMYVFQIFLTCIVLFFEKRIDCFYKFQDKYSLKTSSRPEVLKSAIKTLGKFTGKDLCQSLFCLRSATLLERTLWLRYFPVNFTKVSHRLFLIKDNLKKLKERDGNFCFWEINSLENSHHENFHQWNSPSWKIFLTRNISSWNIPTHFINCLGRRWKRTVHRGEFNLYHCYKQKFWRKNVIESLMVSDCVFYYLILYNNPSVNKSTN